MKLSELQQGQYTIVDEPQSKPMTMADNPLSRIGIGVGSALGSVALGGTQAIEKGFGALTGYDVTPYVEATEKIKQAIYKKPFEKELATSTGGFGEFIGDTAAFFSPTKYITGAQIASARLLPQGAGLVSNLATRVIPEAVGTGAVELARTGGDVESAKFAAGLAAGITGATGAIGALAKSTYFPDLEGSVHKALGIQGKKSGGVALKETAKKISGLSVIKEYADKVQVKDADGVIGAFDPAKASYSTTLQAWNEARKKVFSEYTDLAKKAGEKTTVDLTGTLADIAQSIDEPRLLQYHRAAATLYDDIMRNFPDPKNADILKVQNFVKDLNGNTANQFAMGLSDAATSEIYAGTAKNLAGLLDYKINSTTGGNYAPLRAKYSALKSIEEDLVRRFSQEERKIGGGLTDYVGMFGSGDMVAGLMSVNPAQFARGAVTTGAAAIRRKLTQPERYLIRSFDLLDAKTTEPLTYRLFGGLHGKERTALDDLAEKEIRPSIVSSGDMEQASKKIQAFKSGEWKDSSESSLLDVGQQSKSTQTNEKLSIGDNLSDEDVKRLAEDKYIQNKDSLIKQYLSENGKIANTDKARNLFRDVGYRGSNSATVQKPSSEIAKEAWRENLLKNKGDIAVLFSGGSGAGKTSKIKEVFGDLQKDSQVSAIWDGNLSSLDSALARIGEAEKAGKKVQIIHVYRDPIEAFKDGVVHRSKFNVAEGGRTVPISEIAENTIGSLDTVIKLKKLGYEIPTIFNKTGAQSRVLSDKEFTKLKIDWSLRQDLEKEAKEMLEKGLISKDLFSSLTK